MLACPHQLVDYSMVIIALAFMITLINNRNNNINLFPRRGKV
jgi:hypothetical protein